MMSIPWGWQGLGALGDEAASLVFHKHFSNELQFERGSCFS